MQVAVITVLKGIKRQMSDHKYLFKKQNKRKQERFLNLLKDVNILLDYGYSPDEKKSMVDYLNANYWEEGDPLPQYKRCVRLYQELSAGIQTVTGANGNISNISFAQSQATIKKVFKKYLSLDDDRATEQKSHSNSREYSREDSNDTLMTDRTYEVVNGSIALAAIYIKFYLWL